MNQTASFTLTDRLSQILDGLCGAVAARIAPGVAGWAMQVLMIRLVWTRIRRTEGRIKRMLALFQAGRLRPAGVPEVRDRERVTQPARTRAASPALGLPRSFAWLIPFVPYQAAGYASQLRYLLADPEMVALLAAAPQARRVLAPVCRMLGIEAELLVPVGPDDPGLAEVSEVEPEAGCAVGLRGGETARPGNSWFGARVAVLPDG